MHLTPGMLRHRKQQKNSGIANTRPSLGESIQFHHVRVYVYILLLSAYCSTLRSSTAGAELRLKQSSPSIATRTLIAAAAATKVALLLYTYSRML